MQCGFVITPEYAVDQIALDYYFSMNTSCLVFGSVPWLGKGWQKLG